MEQEQRKPFMVRLNTSERERLQMLAEELGVTASTQVRLLMREEEERRQHRKDNERKGSS